MRTVYDYLGLRTTDIVGLGLGLDNHNYKCALWDSGLFRSELYLGLFIF